MIRRLTCPVCDKLLPVEINGDSPLFPFCSKQCKQADLYRWLTGEYSIIEDLPDELLQQMPENMSTPPEDLPPEM